MFEQTSKIEDIATCINEAYAVAYLISEQFDCDNPNRVETPKTHTLVDQLINIVCDKLRDKGNCLFDIAEALLSMEHEALAA